jgi:glutamyl-tRNA synthetase
MQKQKEDRNLIENEIDNIMAYSLDNALKHEGKAQTNSVLGVLIQTGLKKELIKEKIQLITQCVEKTNSLPLELQQKEFEKLKHLLKKEKEEIEKEDILPELPNTTNKKVKLRIAPFPSGDLHIGNARTYVLNSLYAERYGGKIIFVMDDTVGSKEKKVLKEAYKLIEETVKWLKIKYSGKIIYKSDRLKIYYKYAEELIKKGKAYVCSCNAELLRQNREKGIECGCRKYPVKKQLERWREMFNAKEGDFILRIKTSMTHENPAFRDRVLFRISEQAHPKVGKNYKVWPMLEFSWAIDDHLLGITHIIRGKDLMMESEMEKYIWDIFKFKHPTIIYNGMLRIEGIEGAKLSKSKSQKDVEEGRLTGWDDPRTLSMHSLKRRGIKPEAIIEFIKQIGLTQNDIAVPIDKLYAINRSMIDKTAKRFSFVVNPIKIKIEKFPTLKKIEVKIHPEKEQKRKIQVRDEIFISKEDYEKNLGKEVRLMHLFNVVLKKSNKAIFKDMENKNIQKINWVCDKKNVSVLMPNGERIYGHASEDIKNLKKGEVIQFERFGFCKRDSKISDEEYEFWFSHK